MNRIEECATEDDWTDEFLEKMEAMQASLTCEEMDKIEELWKEDMARRRIALLLLTKPFSWLRQQVQEDRNFALAIAETYCKTMDENLEFYKGVHDLLQQANVWAMVAISAREDVQELIAECETKESNPNSQTA